jgi:hypothetical protein
VAATEIEDAEAMGVEVRAPGVGPRLARPKLGVSLGFAFGAQPDDADRECRGDDSQRKQRTEETGAGATEAGSGEEG